MRNRPSRAVLAVEGAAVAGAVIVAAAVNGLAHWDVALFAALTILSVVSDLIAIETRVNRVVVSASLMTIVIGAVLLGGAPAALMGVITILAGWRKHRYPSTDLLINLVTYPWFPLVAGLFFHWIAEAGGIDRAASTSTCDLCRLHPRARGRLPLVASYSCYVDALELRDQGPPRLLPVLPSEFAASHAGARRSPPPTSRPAPPRSPCSA